MQVPSKTQANKYRNIDAAGTDICSGEKITSFLLHLLAVAWVSIS